MKIKSKKNARSFSVVLYIKTNLYMKNQGNVFSLADLHIHKNDLWSFFFIIALLFGKIKKKITYT